MFRIAAALIALFPMIAAAALPPCAQDDLMRRATDVVQISVQSVDVPAGIGQPNTTVNCTVTGEIVRVFHGRSNVGDRVAVKVLCYTDAVGGGVVTDPEALKQAKVIEVHALNGAPVRGGPSVAILPAATEKMTWEPNCK